MNSYVLEKRTSESILYNIDCTNILGINELIIDIISIESDQEGLVFQNFGINPDPIIFPDNYVADAAKVISVQISEGIIPIPQINQLYTIRALFDTSENNIREATVLLNVTNIPVQIGRIL